MRLTEVFIALIIFMLTMGCFFECYTVFIKNESKARNNIETSVEILKADYMFRKKIKDIKISYWENIEKEILKEKEQIYEMSLGRNVNVNSVEVMRDKDNIPEGFCVTWIYEDKHYVTKEEFSTRSIIK